MALNLAATMDAVAALLSPLVPAVYAWPVREVNAPCAVVGYPTEIPFDLTFRDASQEFTIPIWIVIGPVADKATRDSASAFIEGSARVKSALDGNLQGTVSDARVTTVKFTQLAMSLVDYLSLEYELEVMS